MRIFLTLIIFITTVFSNVYSENDFELGSVIFKINRMEKKIDKIAVMLERYRVQNARNTLNEAKTAIITARQKALALKQSGLRPRSLEYKSRLKEVRTHYLKAESKYSIVARTVLHKPATKLRNELKRKIQKAEEALYSKNVQEAEYFIQKARVFQNKADASIKNGLFLNGHQYLKVAQYFVEKALTLVQNRAGGTRRRGFEENKNNITLLLNRYPVSEHSTKIVKDLYSNALDYLNKAQSHFHKGNLKAANSQLQFAERLTYRIIDLSEDSNLTKAERVKNNYRSLGQYLISVRHKAEQNNVQSRLLDKAELHYAKTESYIQAGDFENAQIQAQLSQRMGLAAFKKLSKSENNPLDISTRFSEVAHILGLQKSFLEANNLFSAKLLHSYAQLNYDKAQQAYNSGKLGNARYLLNITLRLLNKTEQILKNKSAPAYSKEHISEELTRLQNVFSRLLNNPNLNAKNSFKVKQLHTLLKKADTHFNAGEEHLATELLKLIKQQISVILEN